jgi:hypothetical protein
MAIDEVAVTNDAACGAHRPAIQRARQAGSSQAASEGKRALFDLPREEAANRRHSLKMAALRHEWRCRQIGIK